MNWNQVLVYLCTVEDDYFLLMLGIKSTTFGLQENRDVKVHTLWRQRHSNYICSFVDSDLLHRHKMYDNSVDT